MNELNLDPFNRYRKYIARTRLTPEDREILGPLAQVEVLNSDPAEVQQALMEAATADLWSGDPIRYAKAMYALHRAYQLLVTEGMAFRPMLADMEARIDRMHKRTLRRFTREYLERGPQEEEAKAALVELIRDGYWTIEEFDAEVDRHAREVAERREGR
jgi:hypothetical protein